MNHSGEDLVRRTERIFNSPERKNSEILWSLLSEFVLNNQSGLFETDGDLTPGIKKTARVFDATAGQANHDLAAAIHATLTNPATQWSKIRFRDEDLNNNGEAVKWIEDVNRRIHLTLNESNFDTQVAKNYQAYTSLGTMMLLHEEMPRDEEGFFNGFKFNAWHLAEVAIVENEEGLIDATYRKFIFSAQQAFNRWGDRLPREILDAVEDKPEKEFKFLHCIFPRKEEEIKFNDVGIAEGKNRPFASIYIELKTKDIIEEDGFYEFPIYAVRWSSMPGEVYGRSPGHLALPDIRTLNKVKELGLQAINKAVNPPLLTTQRNILGALDLRPNGLSVLRKMDDFKEFNTQARFDVTQFAVEDLRNSIRQIFFLDKLLLPPREEIGEMTAFEVSQRLEQMQRVLGPTLSRLNSEFLTPLIVRCFKVMLRAGALPPVPDIVAERGIDVDIVFVNQLARSQQIEDVTNIQGWVQELGFIAQFKPEIVDNINADAIAKHTAKVRGIPEAVIANDDEVDQIREQRAQQEQAAAALEAGVQMADIQSKTGGGEGA